MCVVPSPARPVVASGRDLIVDDAEGFVLAGGASSRMGLDKASIAIDGRRLLDRVVDALQQLDQVTIVGGEHAHPSVTTVPDRRPGAGPLHAMAHCADLARSPVAVITSCDLPLIDADVIDALVRRLRRSGADGVVPVTDGRPQWLLASWRIATFRPAARHAVSLGHRGPRALTRQLSIEYVVSSDDDRLADADTPADLDRLGVRWGQLDPKR